jgi:hypothetical protein
MPLEY